MVVLEGAKRFWFAPPEAPFEEGAKPVFHSLTNMKKAIPYGIRVADVGVGDLLVFPGHWFHEVHNITPKTLAITNAVAWPKENQEEKKEEKKSVASNLGRRRRGAPIDPEAIAL
jgi:oxalate decarboxylase/phosphoglucose isomerase-like protein (cupin superfamily)